MILYSRWVALSLPTRNKIAEAFGITKKHSTQVDSNVVKHDGYVIEDIEVALTKEAMEKFLGFTFPTPELLWEAVVNKVEGREVEGGEQLLEVLPTKEAAKAKKEHKARVAKTKTATVKASVKPKAVKKTKKNGK